MQSIPSWGIPQDSRGTRFLCLWVRGLHLYWRWDIFRPCIQKVAYDNSTQTMGVLSLQSALGDSCNMLAGWACSYLKQCLLYSVLRRSVLNCELFGTRESIQ